MGEYAAHWVETVVIVILSLYGVGVYVACLSVCLQLSIVASRSKYELVDNNYRPDVGVVRGLQVGSNLIPPPTEIGKPFGSVWQPVI